MNILDEIFAAKRDEVAARRAVRPLAALRGDAEAAPAPRDFVAALAGRAAARGPALIAEVKQRSPSRGLLAAGFDPLRLAQTYVANGASAISVLTDERYFGGRLAYLGAIATTLGPACPPLLRKDFVCDPYQVYEARAAGADAVLLIAAALSPSQLAELHALARSLGLAPLVEVHGEDDLAPALACAPVLVGINNRDLRDFSVDLATSLRLRPLIPAGITVVAESGIHTPADVATLAAVGVQAVLVGEALVTAPDIAARVRALAGAEQEAMSSSPDVDGIRVTSPAAAPAAGQAA